MVTLSIVFRKGHIMTAQLDTPWLNLALYLAAIASLSMVVGCGHPRRRRRIEGFVVPKGAALTLLVDDLAELRFTCRRELVG
jgi:hypothetical protein